jgi:hypothetical protein
VTERWGDRKGGVPTYTGGAFEKAFLLRANEYLNEVAKLLPYYKPALKIMDFLNVDGFEIHTVAMLRIGRKRVVCMVEGKPSDINEMWVCSFSILKEKWLERTVRNELVVRRYEQR